ncbi:hypothetical protein B0T17DRAFT_488750 [Bombardia bombarda]|uniref:NADH:flavin oxidoreductase/NADH oxidase N-terminal domain-containing protein n=1 Tax=Bombardia bombarda TaxID=252184 RepID=A0AA39XAR3_9PEZI|nr:hypothetical protein B0T17DRAFT_488750 [Bombardia bombarda]
MSSNRYPGRPGVDSSPLGQPLTFPFSGRTAKNRFMKASTTEKMASWHPTDQSRQGIPGPELATLYRAWSAGDFGVILTGNMLIDRTNIESPGNTIVPITADPSPTSPLFTGLQALAAAGKSHGSLILGQLNHPGRQAVASIQPDPVSASDVQLHFDFLGETFAKPHPASLDEIRDITAAFVHAAVVLDKAGFDGVQLHGAHGYLLAQFLAETTNLRTDAYGGSLENRARLITDIADGIRAQTRPDFILAIKVNSVEFQAGGLTTEDAAQLCVLLERHTFDFVELSGGTYEELGFYHRKESTKKREAFFLEFAEMIAPRLTKTKTYVTGGLKSAGAMVDALKSVDGVGLARVANSEPNLPRDILSGKVAAAIRPVEAIYQDEFALQGGLAAVQMPIVGKGLQPLDVSDPVAAEAFINGLAGWMKALRHKDGDDVLEHFKVDFLKRVDEGALESVVEAVEEGAR